MWVARARILAFFVLALFVAVLIGMVPGAQPAHAKTFTVNYTGDHAAIKSTENGVCETGIFSGTFQPLCSLRAAIQEANGTKGADTIAFDISTTDPNCNSSTKVCTISPATGLPDITKPVIIDGYTQGDATADTSDDATENTLTEPGKTNAALKIELDGTNAGVFRN
jgi:CSLREA domain-containing protein